MSLKNRLLLYINSLLLIAMIIGVAGILLAAKKNVRNEILSSQSLAIFAIESGVKKNPEYYLFQEEGQAFGLANLNRLRHLKIQFYDTQDNLIDSSQPNINESNTPPKFVESIMTSLISVIPSEKININSRGNPLGYILITPEPKYEINEIWQQVKNGMFVISIFFIFINCMIYLVFFHTLKPINELIEGFKRLENENYKVRISRTNIMELDIIGQKFNRMVKKLKDNNLKIHKLSQDLINIQEQEKRDLARNLHDELGQSLTAIQAEAGAIKNSKNIKSRNLALNSIILISKNMMLSTRELIKKLSLGILDDMGFEIAMSDLVNNWTRRHPNVKVNYNFDKELIGVMPQSFEAHIYRIIQEALTNITKHANPKKATISLSLHKDKKTFRINISNDGVKNKINNNGGIGILGMRERVSQMGGSIDLKKNRNFQINIVLSIQP